MPFPNSVNYNWPAGFPGRIASANPMRSVVSGSDGFRVGTSGLTIAAFAWVNTDGTTVTNAQVGTGDPAGFVYADQQGLTTAYLQEHTMTVPAGFQVGLAEGGDFFAISATTATRGEAVYASTTDGSISTGAAGSPPTGTIATGWTVSQGAAAGSPIIISGPMTVQG